MPVTIRKTEYGRLLWIEDCVGRLLDMLREQVGPTDDYDLDLVARNQAAADRVNDVLAELQGALREGKRRFRRRR